MLCPRSSTCALHAAPKSGCANDSCRHLNTRPLPAHQHQQPSQATTDQMLQSPLLSTAAELFVPGPVLCLLICSMLLKARESQ